MRYALIIAGGSGTRLWPMSTQQLPKQLIPFIEDDSAVGRGRSLLQVAMDRLEGLVPDERILVCAGQSTRGVMLDKLDRLEADRFYGEPMGRDTLNAVGLVAAELERRDPEAVIAVFTADHLIEPVDEFLKIVERGYAIAESTPNALVTFGIAPTHAATGYGYLQLGAPIDGSGWAVDEFKEKPELALAEQYHAAGPEKYLWNSGMFVWKAATLMAAIEKFHPENANGLREVAAAWDKSERDVVLNRVYPELPKISVDFAVMEPASKDQGFTVAAVPMPLSWLDVGSWPSFKQTRPVDEHGNASAGCKTVLLDSRNVLVASDEPDHLITTIGCDDLIIIHTPHSTLVCHANEAEKIKQLHAEVGQKHGEKHV